jgi:hypothetical protein
MLTEELKKFWNEFIINNDQNKGTLLIQFRIKFNNNQFRSITEILKLDISNKDNINILISNITGSWEIKSEEYSEILNIIHFGIIRYKFLDNEISNNQISKVSSKGIYKNSHIISGYSLPNTMEIEKWGYNISYNDNRSFAKINRLKGKCIYEINILNDHNTISWYNTKKME